MDIKNARVTINKFAEPNHKVCIGLESTGHYSENILLYFAKTDHTVFLINPLLTSMERKTTSVRKTKTDIIDCQSICTFVSKNHSVL